MSEKQPDHPDDGHSGEHETRRDPSARRRHPLPNRREGYPQEYIPPRRRQEDLTPVERVLKGMQTYGPLISMATLIYLSIGFKTIKPNDRLIAMEAQLAELRARRDSDHIEFMTEINHVLDSLSRTFAPTQKRTSALARYRCLYLSPETAYTLDLDCDVLLPGYQRFRPPVDQKDPESGALPLRQPPVPAYPRVPGVSLTPWYPPIHFAVTPLAPAFLPGSPPQLVEEPEED